MSDEKRWQRAENILCIRLDSLGDILMTTPAMRALKENHPGRRLTLLTSKSGADIATLIPEVDEAIIYAPPWMKASAPPRDSTQELHMIDCIRQAGFDAAVIFTAFSQSPLPAALMTFLAGIPLRLAHCRENPYYLLTDWVRETDHFGQAEIRHEVRRQLDLVASVGSRTKNEHLSLQVSAVALERIDGCLVEAGLDPERPWFIIHPGSTAPSRRYPVESFARVAHRLASLHGPQVLFTGTEPEMELIESIREKMQVDSFSLAGRLGIDDLAALISKAPLLISNNTGPVHMAAALHTPVVDIYALTNPQHTPWMVPHRTLSHDVPCKYCYKSICPMGHHNCLRLVPPEDVVNAALELLAEQQNG
jgi:lipopolysaccharide heptosyltransferase II